MTTSASYASAYCAATTTCTADDLNKTGLRIAAQTLTTSEFWVEDNAPAATLALYGSVTQVLQALSSSSADIVVIDKPAADGIAKANSAFKVQGTIFTNELYGFAVPRSPQDDPKGLIPKLNSALAAVKTDGTYDALLKKYFG